MAIALRIDEQIDYVLKKDRELPEAEQTVFQLAMLDPDDAAALMDMAGEWKDDAITIRAGRNILTALRLGLKGWSNYMDHKGNTVEFETNGTKLQIPGVSGRPRDYVSNQSIKRLPIEDRKELSQAIQGGIALTEEDAGN